MNIHEEKINRSLHHTALMLNKYDATLIPGRRLWANDNGPASDRISGADDYQTVARHGYNLRMIEDLFSFVGAQPDELALAEIDYMLEYIKYYTDQIENRRKGHGHD